jgi:hypothetical protein
MQNLTREQIISARDRARTKLARQRTAMQATEAELALWDEHLTDIDKAASAAAGKDGEQLAASRPKR